MAMAAFARQTGAFVIAEGIEDGEVLQFLRAINEAQELASDAIIQGGQGYGLGLPAQEMSVDSPAILDGARGREHSLPGG